MAAPTGKTTHPLIPPQIPRGGYVGLWRSCSVAEYADLGWAPVTSTVRLRRAKLHLSIYRTEGIGEHRPDSLGARYNGTLGVGRVD